MTTATERAKIMTMRMDTVLPNTAFAANFEIREHGDDNGNRLAILAPNGVQVIVELVDGRMIITGGVIEEMVIVGDNSVAFDMCQNI